MPPLSVCRLADVDAAEMNSELMDDGRRVLPGVVAHQAQLRLTDKNKFQRMFAQA